MKDNCLCMFGSYNNTSQQMTCRAMAKDITLAKFFLCAHEINLIKPHILQAEVLITALVI